ncbi:MAG: hypothetical protein K0U66_10050 [Gammaproteobacteria bacterium]|nr:hypothetical protein [Gammaproteobacteria bacterium]
MNILREKISIATLASVLAFCAQADGETVKTLASASGSFSGENGRFVLSEWGGTDVPVYYRLPVPLAQLDAATPVLVVMTGRARNADDYRDQWSDLAQQYGFIVLVPEFVWPDWPDETSYDMGNVFRFADRLSVPDVDDLTPINEAQWAFTAIEALFNFAAGDLGLRAQGYSLYGHSSGAGFVHRYMYYKPAARVNYAVAANGAWYLLPRPDIAYPYGVRGSGISRQMLKTAFKRRLTLMFGQQDLGPRRQYHANTEQANAQGPHVVSRAMNFLLLSLITAKQMDTPINWSIRSVPNVGHSNTAMAPFAVEHLFPELYHRTRTTTEDGS